VWAELDEYGGGQMPEIIPWWSRTWARGAAGRAGVTQRGHRYGDRPVTEVQARRRSGFSPLEEPKADARP